MRGNFNRITPSNQQQSEDDSFSEEMDLPDEMQYVPMQTNPYVNRVQFAQPITSNYTAINDFSPILEESF